VSKALYQDGLNHIFICGEMGTGKAMIALSSAYMSPKPQRVLAVCPTHLMEKWIRESKILIPDVKVFNLTQKNVISILEGFRSVRERPSCHEIYVISKERLKLSYGWHPAVLRSERSRFPICPNCAVKPRP
jgi:SNF2 family DNA or RNA helicase